MEAVAMRPVPQSPPAKEHMTERRSSDVNKLTFTFQTMIQIVSTAITIIGVTWWSNAEMKSDIRDMRTRMEYDSKLQEANDRADAAAAENMKESIAELRRQSTLLQLQYGELSKQISQRR
jgi:hypothetical protein